MIISELQRKLATWTTADPTRRVDRLLRLMAHPVWLEEAARITLSSRGAHTPGVDGVDKVEKLNQKLKGWADFYQFVDFKAKVFSHIDRVVFWKLAHWLAHKYRSRIKPLLRQWCKRPAGTQAKTWVLFGNSNRGQCCGIALLRLVGRPKKLFRWRLPDGNPYLRTEGRNTFTSRYPDVARAFSPA